jgi:hypothetical protein
MTDDCARCGHSRASHVPQLFGVVCGGREWMDDSSFRCSCEGFIEVKAECLIVSNS